MHIIKVGKPKGTIIENIPWSRGANSDTITENVQTNTYLKWVNSTLATTKNNPNMKAVAYMMDTSRWSNFTGGVNGAYSIGGPTLEMFVQSYNAKHTTNQLGTYGTTVNDITSTNANAKGYMLKIGDASWTISSVSGLDTSSTTEEAEGNMWIKTKTDKAFGMWLASPASNTDDSVLVVDWNRCDCWWKCGVDE